MNVQLARLARPVSDRDHTIGPATAAVTLVEYGDYECPFCGMAHPTVTAILHRMKGQIRFVFRHFPLSSIHPHAQLAAEAAEASGAQGKFWPMHDTLFTHQNALDAPHLIGYASALGLDDARVATELRDHVWTERVREDFLSGVRSGVNGTPTFFINGVRHDGSYQFESLYGALLRAMA